MRTRLLIVSQVLINVTLASAATRVLVLGGSQPYSDTYSGSPALEAAFPPSGVASNLQSILEGDSGISQPVGLKCVNTFQTNSAGVYCSSRTLMSWFYWPDAHTNTLALLRDDWDYVVMIDDPLVSSCYPEYHLEGVRDISEEVRRTGGQPVLVMGWSSAGVPLSTFGEMAYRVGAGTGVPVAPAGYAWNNVSAGLRDSGVRPTPRGAYVTAATVYSRLFGRSATNSSFVPAGMSESDRDSLANTAFSTVQDEASASHYAGSYVGPIHFVAPANKKRRIEVADYNSSTEGGIADQWDTVLGLARIQYFRHTSTYQSFPLSIGHVIDLCQSRFYFYATTNYWANHAAFDYMDNAGGKTMIYGLDRVIYPYPDPEQETGAAWITSYYLNQGAYFVPVRLLWARIRSLHPEFPWQPDGHHMSDQILQGIATMMYTLLSGRCPVGDEPADPTSLEWEYWFCRKTGYEIAWQLASLNRRVPGFEVLPRATVATNVTTTADETLTVRFRYAPTSSVTVAVSLDNTNAAIVNPSALVFTPMNYGIPQTVAIRATKGATLSEVVNVQFNTISDDPVFHGLNDRWAYNAVRTSTQDLAVVQKSLINLALSEDTPAVIELGVAGGVASNTVVVGPLHGAYSVTNATYTPASNYFGPDSFSYYATVNGTQTIGSVALTITNTADAVSLTAPVDGASFSSVARIPLGVSGYWDGGRVDYLADGALIKSVSNTPWTAVWTNAVAGSYDVMAIAVDPAGVAATSSVATLVVTNSGGIWWTTQSGEWGDSNNWLAGVIPAGQDRALFSEQDISGVVTVRIAGAQSARRMVFGDAHFEKPEFLMGVSNAIGAPVFNQAGPKPVAWILSDGGNTSNTLTLSATMPTVTVNDLGRMPVSVAEGANDFLATMAVTLESPDGLVKDGPGVLLLSRSNAIGGGVTIKSGQGGVMVGDSGALGAASVTLGENTWLGCPDGIGVNVVITNDLLLAGSSNANYRIGPGMAATMTVSGKIQGTNTASGSVLYLGGRGRGIWAKGEALPSIRTVNTITGAQTFTVTNDIVMGSRSVNFLGNWPCTGGTTNRVMGGRLSAGTLNYNYGASDGTSITILGGEAQVDLSGNISFYSTINAPLVIQDRARVTVAGVLYGYTLFIKDQAQVTAGNVYGRDKDVNPVIYFQGGTTTVNRIQTSKIVFDGGLIRARVPINSWIDIASGVSAYNFAIHAGGMRVDSAGQDVGIVRDIGHGGGSVDGGIRKLGSGTLELSGSNTFNGPIRVDEGVLRRSVAEAFPDNADLTVNSGAVLDLGGYPLVVSRYSGGGQVSNGVLTVTESLILSNEAVSISGDLTISNGLFQVGLTNVGPAVTVSGAITIGGTLQVRLDGPAVSGNHVVLIRAGAINGTFDSASLPDGWVVEYSATEVIASIPSAYLMAPSAIAATDGTMPDQVVVSWLPVERANAYRIWRRLESSGFSGAEELGTSVSTWYGDTTPEPNRTYYYWVQAMNASITSGVGMADSGYAWLPNSTNEIPYRESFEGYRTNEVLSGRNGWYATMPDAFKVTTEAGLIASLGAYPDHFPIQTNHTRVAEIQGELTNCIAGPAGSNTWVDMMIRFGAMMEDTVQVSESTQCGFVLNGTGRLQVYCYFPEGATNGWLEINHAPVSTAEWARLSVQLDYHGAHTLYPGRGWFQCYLNGQLLTNITALTSPDGNGGPGGGWLPMAVTNPEKLSKVLWRGQGTLDDLVVDSILPYGFAWTVRTSTGPHGSVFPSGETQVWHGSNAVISIQPDPYYAVQSIRVDGRDLGGASQYVFEKVTNDHDLAAAFTPIFATNGVPQWWLANYGYSNDFDVAALADEDHDRMATWQEYVAGTDPKDPGSLLAVSNGLSPAGVGMVLHWPSVWGRVYHVDRATNLLTGFLPVTSNLEAFPPVNSFTDAVIHADTLYYRIRVGSQAEAPP